MRLLRALASSSFSFVPRHHSLGVGLGATPADSRAVGSRRPASSYHLEPSVLVEPSLRPESTVTAEVFGTLQAEASWSVACKPRHACC